MKSDQKIRNLAKDICKLAVQAVTLYYRETDAIIDSGCKDKNRIECTLDGMLDFCFDKNMLKHYKRLCRYYYEMFKISSICLRYSSIYGPRSSSDTVIPSFILNAIKGEPLIIKGDGTQKRQFSYVKDIVEGTSLAYKSDIEHDVFNINGGYTSLASIQEIAELVKTNVDNKNTNEVRIIKEEQRKGDITHPELAISIDKAKKRLGYEPKVNLPEGILKVEEWYKRRVEKFSRLI